MDILEKIDEEMQKRSMSDYRLAKESLLPLTTISNMRRRHTIPSVVTLDYICRGLGISMAEFFRRPDEVWMDVTEKQRITMDYYVLMNDQQQELLLRLVKSMATQSSVSKTADKADQVNSEQ